MNWRWFNNIQYWSSVFIILADSYDHDFNHHWFKPKITQLCSFITCITKILLRKIHFSSVLHHLLITFQICRGFSPRWAELIRWSALITESAWIIATKVSSGLEIRNHASSCGVVVRSDTLSRGAQMGKMSLILANVLFWSWSSIFFIFYT